VCAVKMMISTYWNSWRMCTPWRKKPCNRTKLSTSTKTISMCFRNRTSRTRLIYRTSSRKSRVSVT
jgi:hypothetical protein